MKKTIFTITMLLLTNSTAVLAQAPAYVNPKIEIEKLAAPAFEENPTYTITLKDGVFSPETTTIRADMKVKLLIKNEDSATAEFESKSLSREKVIKGNTEAPIFIGPLKAGEYSFEDEFNPKTAQGKIIVR